jgi:hypothetical protein
MERLFDLSCYKCKVGEYHELPEAAQQKPILARQSMF